MTSIPQRVDAAWLAWSPQLVVTHAEGACEAVFGAPADAVRGQGLARLFGVDAARAAALDASARGAGEGGHAVEFVTHPRVHAGPTGLDPHEEQLGARTWRLTLGVGPRGAEAGVVELRGLLAGAPPVQLSGLSSALSHEIRNPLSSVKMAVQTLARNAGLNDRDRRRLTIANREIRTMERMLWLLSEYGRDTQPVLDAQPLRTLVQESAALVAPELAERRNELLLEEDPDLPRVRVDAARVRPVLAQVLLNVALGLAEGDALTVRLRRAEGTALLELPDPSAALVPEEAERLFEPFGSRLARGAGLSLAALRRVIIGQGGDLRAEGGATPGVVFTLRFAPQG